jgi:uncharacterized cupin superfamily protein
MQRGYDHMSNDYPHILRKADIEAKEFTFSHPWNPKSQLTGTMMGRLAGLKRTGVSIVRVPPGKESFAYHLHHREEEWVYVLSGTAVTTIDGREYTLQEGDFAAFPTPSVAHVIANHADRDLLYMMGGENLSEEIADFPTLDRRIVRLNDALSVYRLSDGKPFFDRDA